jgi:hypothetical protein
MQTFLFFPRQSLRTKQEHIRKIRSAIKQLCCEGLGIASGTNPFSAIDGVGGGEVDNQSQRPPGTGARRDSVKTATLNGVSVSLKTAANHGNPWRTYEANMAIALMDKVP